MYREYVDAMAGRKGFILIDVNIALSLSFETEEYIYVLADGNYSCLKTGSNGSLLVDMRDADFRLAPCTRTLDLCPQTQWPHGGHHPPCGHCVSTCGDEVPVPSALLRPPPSHALARAHSSLLTPPGRGESAGSNASVRARW